MNNDDSSDDEDIYMFAIGKGGHQLYPIQCGDQELDLLIDSGCKLNVLDRKTFRTLRNKPELLPSKKKILPYGKDSKPLKVLGKFKMDVSSQGKTVRAKFHVVEGDSGAILGSVTAVQLDLLRIGPAPTTLNALRTVSPEVRNILKEYPKSAVELES